MLKGFTVPQSRLGHATLDPPPPWHYSSDVVGAEYLGDAELLIPEVPGEEFHALAPVKMGQGFRVGMAYSVTDLKILKDFTAWRRPRPRDQQTRAS